MLNSFEALTDYYFEHRTEVDKLKIDGRTLESAIRLHHEMSTVIPVKVEDFITEEVDNTDYSRRYINLSHDVEDLFSLIKAVTTIFLIKPVQSGKTGEVYKIIEHTYKSSCTIFLSTQVAVAGQTNKRGLAKGWNIKDFSDMNVAYAKTFLEHGCGRKVAISALMEINNVKGIMSVVTVVNCPVVLIVDEGDKNRNTKKDEDDEDQGDGLGDLPPVTRAIQIIKNQIADRNDGSKVIFVTATPQGLFCAERDDNRLVIVKEPFKNWRGVAHNHPYNIELKKVFHSVNKCKARDKWTGNTDDRRTNVFRGGLAVAIRDFEELGTKDPSVTQVMLVSLESRNDTQKRMTEFIVEHLSNPDDYNVIVFNGENENKKLPLLSDKIAAGEGKKCIVVSGIMASRGISFTDLSDEDNKFELVIQVHAAKMDSCLNTAVQAMRIYGPERVTMPAGKPILYCNEVTYRDNTHNFLEGYRICEDLAKGLKEVKRGKYDRDRTFVSKKSQRFMKVNPHGPIMLYQSLDPKDHEPITY